MFPCDPTAGMLESLHGSLVLIFFPLGQEEPLQKEPGGAAAEETQHPSAIRSFAGRGRATLVQEGLSLGAPHPPGTVQTRHCGEPLGDCSCCSERAAPEAVNFVLAPGMIYARLQASGRLLPETLFVLEVAGALHCSEELFSSDSWRGGGIVTRDSLVP